ncbi:MAG TPA: gliding motility protein GldB [Marinilabiliales bacterium]|nr:gliding motility protein GldB [Marinilabiliales bacterium]
MMKPVVFIYTVIVFLIFSGCSHSKWDVDISNIETRQEIERFDVDLFSVNTDSIWQQVPKWEQKYGNFFDAYNQQVIKIGGTNQLDYARNLTYFLTEPYISGAYADVQVLFKNLPFEHELADAFKRYYYHFPEKEIPAIYTHISGFNQSIVIDSGYLSISLDKYLGAGSKYYTMLRTPQYLSANMHPDKIPSDVMFAVAITEFPYKSESDDLISQMLYYGKIHLFLDAMLPQMADTLKWGFTKEKLKWCHKNENLMWLYLVENKLVFTTNYKEIKRYIDDGPFTSTFSKESPSRTGRWLGYQIILSYMKTHPEVTLPQLMGDQNYHQLLNESRYKP